MSESLKVLQGGVLVGALDKGDSEPFYGFTYDEAYLKSSSAVPLSLSLPLSARRYTGYEAMPFFEGLLPEGDVREAVARQFHVSAMRPMELIRVLGKDCAGDVVILEEGDSCDLPGEAAYVPLPNTLEEIVRYPYGAIAQLRAEYRLSLAGGQEKIALFHDDRAPLDKGWFAPLAGAPSSHIIKPQIADRFPLLASNEFICMEAARAMGFEVPETAIVLGEHPLFIVRRYDREMMEGSGDGALQVLRRVHQEDFCQAIGLTSGEKYEKQKTHHAQDMARILVDYAARPIEALGELFRRIALSYLIGNCDAHLKNYSLFLNGGVAVSLAPVYDLVCTTIYDGRFGGELNRSMGIRIGDHLNIDRVTPSDFLLLARDMRQPKRVAATILEELVGSMEAAFETAAIELAKVGAGDDAYAMAQRIVAGAAKRKDVMLKAVGLLS